MDIKKSPKADLESNRLTYVLLGFVFVLAVLYVGFEWTDKEITVYEVEESLVNEAEEEMTEITFQEETPPPPPPPAEVPQVIEEITIVDDNTEVAEVDFSSEDDETKVQEVIMCAIRSSQPRTVYRDVSFASSQCGKTVRFPMSRCLGA